MSFEEIRIGLPRFLVGLGVPIEPTSEKIGKGISDVASITGAHFHSATMFSRLLGGRT